MIKDLFRGRSIKPGTSLLSALKKMDELDKKLLVVLNDDKFIGLISIGDIQRAIIQNRSLETEVKLILRDSIKVANVYDTEEDIHNMMLKYRMEFCPVVEENGGILKVFFWEDIFKEQKIKHKSNFDNPVVIMAGGLGTRLRPLTYVMPKPLMPMNEKTILEEIFSRFCQYGCKRYYISVNYKAELIEYYIRNLDLPYSIQFFKENSPLGTAGSLTLLKNEINETFFVNNCDILINMDYSEILDYHKINKNELTMVSAIKNYPIPYGTLETKEDGLLESIHEKPDIAVKINTGFYILEPHLIDEIPENEFYHITFLIEKLRKQKRRVGVFPVSEQSLLDIGDWKQYLTAIGQF